MSSDINFNLNDLSDARSAAAKVAETFYPNNTQTYKRTTESTQETTGKTLTSNDPLRVLQGDGIYRNPRFCS